MASIAPSPLAPAQRYGLPIPVGWYHLCPADELAPGAVRTLTLFGGQWVLFRDQAGTAGVVEPYCRHLGAHLGVGGVVDGALLRCPFHKWGYDTAGFCRDIPYARKMPPVLERAPALRALPVREAAGGIWAWYHPAGAAPDWSLDALVEAVPADWRQRSGPAHDIHTIAQEIGENSVDGPHLVYVHGQPVVPNGQSQYAGPLRQTLINTQLPIEGEDGQMHSCDYRLNLQQWGPGLQILRQERYVSLLNIMTITPLDTALTRLRFTFFHPPYEDGFRQRMIDELIEEQVGQRGDYAGVEADLPIWDNKIYRAQPLLCDGDGPILQYRAWFRQFYPVA